MGILLSVGISKLSIVTQYIVECVLIAVLAFSLSSLTATYAAQSAGDVFLKQMVAQQQEENARFSDRTLQSGLNYNTAEGEIDLRISTPEEIDIHVGPSELILVLISELAIILIAVSISSVTVIRLKPKEILSKLS